MKTKKESDEPSLFDRRKRVFGRLFVRTARTIQERAIERIRSHGFDDYRLGDNAVLIHLEMKGNRISELAQRSGLSKQALSQLVADLERRGVVNRRSRDDRKIHRIRRVVTHHRS